MLNITVVNQLTTDGLVLHFHGITQLGTPFSDGAASLTQCDIPPGGGSYSYVFQADAAGTFWWHAHAGLLMDSGLLGQLVVREASPAQGACEQQQLPRFPVHAPSWCAQRS